MILLLVYYSYIATPCRPTPLLVHFRGVHHGPARGGRPQDNNDDNDNDDDNNNDTLMFMIANTNTNS